MLPSSEAIVKPVPLSPDAGVAVTCLQPTAAVTNWVKDAIGSAWLGKVVMVDAGEGNTQGELWWVIGASYSDQLTQPTSMTWLTNAPTKPASSKDAPMWINITNGWSGVSWADDRLARGQAAQAAAVTCLQT